MSVIPLSPPPSRTAIKGLVPFALGFRPFFLLAGLAAVLLLGVWLVMWVGRVPPVAYYGFIGWHSHEMLFGYAGAVIGGFLLTAVRNWTGLSTPSGAPLAGLAALWLAGRLLPLIPGVPGVLIALVDVAFLPAVALALASPLWKGSNRRNRLFLPLLGAMGVANLLVHLEALGLATTASRGIDGMLALVVLIVAFVGGRVIPFFTEKAVPAANPKRNPVLEQWGFGFLIALAAAYMIWPWPPLVGVLAAGVALTQALRLIGWHHPGVWRLPIQWVLHVGMGWLVVGFALESLGAFGLFPPNLAVHAITVGGIGVLTLGMMARVALGHTGRDIDPPALIGYAFALLNLGAAARVFLPLLMPERYTFAVHLAGGLWLLAFLAFTVIYTPVLLRPRIDGRPG